VIQIGGSLRSLSNSSCLGRSILGIEHSEVRSTTRNNEYGNRKTGKFNRLASEFSSSTQRDLGGPVFQKVLGYIQFGDSSRTSSSPSSSSPP